MVFPGSCNSAPALFSELALIQRVLLKPLITALTAFYLLPCAWPADFTIQEANLSQPLSVVAYGDMRFTDPAQTTPTNPKIRKFLVDRIAAEIPSAVLLSGDVPWHGAEKNDYAVYRSETAAWKSRKLRIYPALGNHELNGPQPECLHNWWAAFPELTGRRWYSVALGERVYLINLDSNSPLSPGSEQDKWLVQQLTALPKSTKFVFINLHHPPVSDFQVDGDPDHNARSNEVALAERLRDSPARQNRCFIVTAGHVHNYERFSQDGIVYLVSGGGGAKPRPIVRNREDLYRSSSFPNYHYLKFVLDGDTLRCTMFRVTDPEGDSPIWQEADHFSVPPE